MSYRDDTFKSKFNDSARHLGVAPDQVISLKLRESVGSYSDYRNLLKILEHEVGIRWQKIDANLQGNGYLVGDAKVKIIIVEHETGLEILYIAGSIASLICLIPLVLHCWNSIRGRHVQQHPRDFHSIEIRRLDSNGHLKEDQALSQSAPWSAPFSFINTALTSAAEVLDTEIKHLRDDVQALMARVTELERKISKRKRAIRKTVKKTKNREKSRLNV